MSKKIFAIDIEATSEWAHNTRMLSLSTIETAILPGGRLRRPMKVKEFYFATMSEVPSSAVAVHGLDRKILWEKSGGRDLEAQLPELDYILYHDVNLVGYNLKTYDTVAITNNVMNVGGARPRWGEIIDVLPMARKRWPKGVLPDRTLTTVFAQVLREQGLSLEYVMENYRLFCQGGTTTTAHTASWDCYMTLLVYEYLMRTA